MNFSHQIHNLICIQEMTSELHFNDTEIKWSSLRRKIKNINCF